MSYYHHFSICERGKIEELNKLGFSARTIGKRIGRHHSSIAREMKRCESYEAQPAQADYSAKRAKSKPNGKYSSELGSLLKEKIEQTWSPEQIAKTVAKGGYPLKPSAVGYMKAK